MRGLTLSRQPKSNPGRASPPARPIGVPSVRQQAAPCERSAGGYSGTDSPEPPNSAGKSFSLGSPSFIGSTVSA
jgi:hypothetical protein